ncbi:alpha/beta hydrolase-fold protein [Streptomyces sp. M10(2022)]
MITVVPDGGLKGWYADWVMQNTAEGAADWETFHLSQVVPFIDANLRTIADRDHRAVVGLSMGATARCTTPRPARPLRSRRLAFGRHRLRHGRDPGRGPGHRAQRHGRVVRGEHLHTVRDRPVHGYGPYVDSDAIFGSPYPVLNADRVWKAVDPAAPANLARLNDTGITLYTGSQGPIDHFTRMATSTVKSRLDQRGIPSRVLDYGNGSTLSPNCDGGHNYGCWAAAFADYIPRLAASFEAADQA